jgi:acrylyl-CoA reductase (NADPH)
MAKTATGLAALVVEESERGLTTNLREIDERELRAAAPPEADVTVRVRYSTLNYKDGLAMNGLGDIVKRYPHVPGVDLAGVVECSDSPLWKPGDEVIAGGFRMGELYWGGFASKARVSSGWLVPLPEGLTPERAMAIGTAGLTAMLAIMALEEHGLTPQAGEVLVTGAAGGVGGVAVAVLAALGYRVAAATGRAETHDYLRELGAAVIVDRTELSSAARKPLMAQRWAGAVDTVGGTTLATILASLISGASVAATGLVGGRELETTVIPFLLRGVNLLGIDSVSCPLPRRREAWSRLAKDLPVKTLDRMTTVVPLRAVPELGRRILEGKVQGRVVVDVGA